MAEEERHCPWSRLTGLVDFDLQLRPEWKAHCLHVLETQFPDFRSWHVDSQGRQLVSQVLFTDIRSSGTGAFPASQASGDGTIQGIFFVQADEIYDVSRSLHERFESGPTQKRTFKLLLHDGVKQIQAVEAQRIDVLHAELSAGVKLLLRGPITISDGLLLLTPDNVHVLGGMVSDLETTRQRIISIVCQPPTGWRGPRISLEHYLAAAQAEALQNTPPPQLQSQGQVHQRAANQGLQAPQAQHSMPRQQAVAGQQAPQAQQGQGQRMPQAGTAPAHQGMPAPAAAATVPAAVPGSLVNGHTHAAPTAQQVWAPHNSTNQGLDLPREQLSLSLGHGLRAAGGGGGSNSPTPQMILPPDARLEETPSLEWPMHLTRVEESQQQQVQQQEEEEDWGEEVEAEEEEEEVDLVHERDGGDALMGGGNGDAFDLPLHAQHAAQHDTELENVLKGVAGCHVARKGEYAAPSCGFALGQDAAAAAAAGGGGPDAAGAAAAAGNGPVCLVRGAQEGNDPIMDSQQHGIPPMLSFEGTPGSVARHRRRSSAGGESLPSPGGKPAGGGGMGGNPSGISTGINVPHGAGAVTPGGGRATEPGQQATGPRSAHPSRAGTPPSGASLKRRHSTELSGASDVKRRASAGLATGGGPHTRTPPAQRNLEGLFTGSAEVAGGGQGAASPFATPIMQPALTPADDGLLAAMLEAPPTLEELRPAPSKPSTAPPSAHAPAPALPGSGPLAAPPPHPAIFSAPWVPAPAATHAAPAPAAGGGMLGRPLPALARPAIGVERVAPPACDARAGGVPLAYPFVPSPASLGDSEEGGAPSFGILPSPAAHPVTTLYSFLQQQQLAPRHAFPMAAVISGRIAGVQDRCWMGPNGDQLQVTVKVRDDEGGKVRAVLSEDLLLKELRVGSMRDVHQGVRDKDSSLMEASAAMSAKMAEFSGRIKLQVMAPGETMQVTVLGENDN